MPPPASTGAARRLLLLRHASAQPPPPGERDFERALTLVGREAGSRIGAFMARQSLRPDRALVSAARRARETWEAVAAALGGSPPRVDVEEALYDASAERILAVLHDLSTEAPTVLVVAHNPALGELTAMLRGGGEPFASLPTAGLALLEFPIETWADLAPRSGQLVHFVDPGTLTA